VGPPVILAPQTPPAGVPEPSGWLLMIVGCGIVGAALRRRMRSERLRP
jgi:hypothetical protein